MYRIRHYDQSLHPDVFRSGGWRGWCIVALNWVRWRLETFVQLLVIRFFADVAKMPPERSKIIERMFHVDVEAEKVEMLQTSPLTPPRETPESEPRARRYEAGRKGVLDTFMEEDAQGPLPNRPVPLSDMAARYGGDKRAKRYAKGHRWTVAAVGEDFESTTEAS
jgi:hypothetical protein